MKSFASLAIISSTTAITCLPSGGILSTQLAASSTDLGAQKVVIPDKKSMTDQSKVSKTCSQTKKQDQGCKVSRRKFTVQGGIKITTRGEDCRKSEAKANENGEEAAQTRQKEGVMTVQEECNVIPRTDGAIRELRGEYGSVCHQPIYYEKPVCHQPVYYEEPVCYEQPRGQNCNEPVYVEQPRIQEFCTREISYPEFCPQEIYCNQEISNPDIRCPDEITYYLGSPCSKQQYQSPCIQQQYQPPCCYQHNRVPFCQPQTPCYNLKDCQQINYHLENCPIEINHFRKRPSYDFYSDCDLFKNERSDRTQRFSTQPEIVAPVPKSDEPEKEEGVSSKAPVEITAVKIQMEVPKIDENEEIECPSIPESESITPRVGIPRLMLVATPIKKTEESSFSVPEIEPETPTLIIQKDGAALEEPEELIAPELHESPDFPELESEPEFPELEEPKEETPEDENTPETPEKEDE